MEGRVMQEMDGPGSGIIFVYMAMVWWGVVMGTGLGVFVGWVVWG